MIVVSIVNDPDIAVISGYAYLFSVFELYKQSIIGEMMEYADGDNIFSEKSTMRCLEL